ncbi:hypothetical protein PCANC_11869 [Puccinia coronata f. sp. avenae]|uniref:Uncharacterized protein n=2 Tax=Puccinia coronata f. sp. avenae TaxID=200324 RepID=A0A2N5SV26_9BASI|nr:hypothetical protein PCANC_11869 [Puccinia coronata f. sp. avenae]
MADMLLNFNPLTQSAVCYLAWKVASAYAAFSPAEHDWVTSILNLDPGREDPHEGMSCAEDDWVTSILNLNSYPEDPYEGSNCATSLKRKRPAEGEPLDSQTYYCSGMVSHPTNFLGYSDSGINAHPTLSPDDSGFQTVNPEDFVYPSPEKQRKIGENDYGEMSYLTILESHVHSTGDGLAGTSHGGNANSLEKSDGVISLENHIPSPVTIKPVASHVITNTAPRNAQNRIQHDDQEQNAYDFNRKELISFQSK